MGNIPKNQVTSQGTIAQVEHEEAAQAKRVKLVHPDGSDITELSPLPTTATIDVGSLTVSVALDAFTKVPADNAISVGTEDGTQTGVKHTIKIGSDGLLQVKDTASEASLASIDSKLPDLNTTPIKTIQIFTKPFKAITRVYPDPTPGVEVYQSRSVNDTGPIQETATVTYADGASKQEFLKVSVV